ncbi:hypothetical protein EJD97_022433, partial [Solanum chilense]
PKPLAMRLLMADQTMKRPIEILHDVLVKVERSYFRQILSFLIVKSILKCLLFLRGHSLLRVTHPDMEKRQMKFRLNNEEATFKICRSMRQSCELQLVYAISYKEKMKKDYDLKSEKGEFMVGDLVLLDISRLRWLPGKLKSKWTGPYLITQLFPHGAVELETKEGVRFK